MIQYQIERVVSCIGDELASFEQNVQACHWSSNGFNEVIAHRGLLYVVRMDGMLVAYLLLQNQYDVYEIMQLSVHPKYRQQGIAYQLLQVAINYVKTQLVDAILLEVRESNGVAISLYKKLGFNEVGCRKGYYPTENGFRESALLMRYDFV